MDSLRAHKFGGGGHGVHRRGNGGESEFPNFIWNQHRSMCVCEATEIDGSVISSSLETVSAAGAQNTLPSYCNTWMIVAAAISLSSPNTTPFGAVARAGRPLPNQNGT